MPKSWLTLPKLKKFPLHPRGPRTKIFQVAEALPYLGPYASTPARKLARALIQHGYSIEAEVPFAGGNKYEGGMVVDFYLRSMKTVLRVQGTYWHTRPGSSARDDSQSFYLRAHKLRVVDIWESDINTRLDWVLEYQIGIRP